MLILTLKEINIKTVVFCNDKDAPAQKFSDDFICGKYNDEQKINEFVKKVDIVTFEFENIPFETLHIKPEQKYKCSLISFLLKESSNLFAHRGLIP